MSQTNDNSVVIMKAALGELKQIAEDLGRSDIDATILKPNECRLNT